MIVCVTGAVFADAPEPHPHALGFRAVPRSFQRKTILAQGFTENMQFLQSYPPVDVIDLLTLAEQIRAGPAPLPTPLIDTGADLDADEEEDYDEARDVGGAVARRGSRPGITRSSSSGSGKIASGLGNVKSWLSKTTDRVKQSAPASKVISGFGVVGSSLKDFVDTFKQ